MAFAYFFDIPILYIVEVDYYAYDDDYDEMMQNGQIIWFMHLDVVEIFVLGSERSVVASFFFFFQNS